jgi:hypothetical protein
MKEILDLGKTSRNTLLVDLIEHVSKNGSIYFHELVASPPFMVSFIKILKKKRKKKGIMGKFETKKSVVKR